MTCGETSRRLPDFRVRYRRRPRSPQLVQHMRCDFSYEGDDIDETGIYMIWPEFEDSSGRPLPDSASVPDEGTATMWILSDELREEAHRHRIKPGVRGHLVVGRRRIAEVEVTDVIGLAGRPG